MYGIEKRAYVDNILVLLSLSLVSLVLRAIRAFRRRLALALAAAFATGGKVRACRRPASFRSRVLSVLLGPHPTCAFVLRHG
eukprot:COSAG06_NODE_52166_length_307_cov_0.995192_1_plen_81_part_01